MKLKSLVFFLTITLFENSYSLPANFVYLRQIDPSIQQDIKYATNKNFTGETVRGYFANECILKRPVALALKKVQKALLPRGFSLKVYDCYRPQKATDNFVKWAKNPNSMELGRQFHPRLPKERLIPLGYIASRSTHSKGTTVDLTLVPLNSPQPPIQDLTSYDECHSLSNRKIPDNSIDMGTGYDCFDKLSHTLSSKIKKVSKKAFDHRLKLLRAMQKGNFRNYSKEWWHYSYRGISSGRTYYNFDILEIPN